MVNPPLTTLIQIGIGQFFNRFLQQPPYCSNQFSCSILSFQILYTIMRRSISRHSKSPSSSSCEGASAELSTSYSSSHNSKSLVRRSRDQGGYGNSCCDGGDHIAGSRLVHRRRKCSLSPSGVNGSSSNSKANSVKKHSCKIAINDHVEHEHTRRTHVRYHEQADELSLQARLRSLNSDQPGLRFSPSSSSASSSSSSLETKFQCCTAHDNHSSIAAEECYDSDQVLKSIPNYQHNHSHFSRFWKDCSDGGADHDFSQKSTCNGSGLGLCRALFGMFLALALSLCGRNTICLRDLWNSTAVGGGGGGNGRSCGKEERGSGRMQLVTVSMLGSMDWVRVVVRCDESVRATIQAVLKAFSSQQCPPPHGSDPDAYHLHYSAFSLQCLDSDELVQNLGARSFVLCPRSLTTPQESGQKLSLGPRDSTSMTRNRL